MHLTNANIYRPRRGFVPGIVEVDGDRIVSIGGDMEAGGNGDVMDLAGGFVLPGLVDTHFHLTSLALKAQRCDLSRVGSATELGEALAAYARAHDGPHVVGIEWDEGGWQDPSYPTRHMLDAIDSTRKVLARRICGHIGVVNTRLLRELTPSPELIDGDRGVVREHALWQANELCTAPPEALAAGIEHAIGELHRLGVTAIHDIVEPSRIEPYLVGIRRSQKPLRIDALVHAPPSELARIDAMCRDLDAAYFRVAGVKCFLDGSLGGKTAALNRPYEGEGQGSGQLLMKTHELQAIVRGAFEAGRMCAMHAIGDRAIDQACDALDEFPADAALFRIEHCEIVGPRQLERLEKCRPILAVQPNFIRNWSRRGGLYEARLGKDRLPRLNPLRTLRSAGLDLIFGSDGMPPGPLYGLKGATEHPIDAQRLTLEEAIDGYTGAANAVGLHRREAGVLEPGRLADLTVLDANPLTTDTDTLTVTHTLVGGRVVYRYDKTPAGE